MPRKKKTMRKAQSEVIGGLIVLTLLFAMVVPMLINTYNSTVNMGVQVKQSLQEQRTAYNEKIEIKPLDPNNEAFIRADWIPGVFINNTGTVSVTLTKLYLVNKLNNSIYRIYDLRYARPGITPDIKVMLVDVDLIGGGNPPPPAGSPIVLDPGENLLVVFNATLLPYAPNLIVLVESARGVLHPLVGTSKAETLYPGRPGAGGGAGGGGPGLWRGIFAPQSGFDLPDGYALANNGQVWAWKPPHLVYTCDGRGNPIDVPYRASFIYDDPRYPGLYKIYLEVGYSWWTNYYLCVDGTMYYIEGRTIEIRGFVGTYDPGDGTYVSGYAYEVYRNGRRIVAPSNPINLGSRGIAITDFDANGISELTFYDYLNGPNYGYTSNIDGDADRSVYRDAMVWTYMVARDISGVNYIKITVKVNYYWTTTFWGGCPDWDTRDLRIFALVVWEYQPDGTWKIHQFKDFVFTTTKPKQYQETAVFPVNSSKTYRVGVLFYDNYRDWEGFGYNCYTDFTYALEHMIVEYGILNPLFQESPPLYIIAIPDPNLISGIGEQDFMNAYNITDINEAKLRAQATLLNKLKEELNYAGISGYTVITSQQQACDLLFGSTPPKYAVIIWLQGGNVSVPYVLYTAYGFGCTGASSDYAIYTRIRDYHWVWVWPMETPFASPDAFRQYNSALSLSSYGRYLANITDQGIQTRLKAYAFYLFNTLPFVEQISITPGYEYLLISNGTFYANETVSTTYYGTSAYWVYRYGDGGPGTGAIVVNPVHLDWDITGDGVVVDTLVQQVVYASLDTWNYIVQG